MNYWKTILIVDDEPTTLNGLKKTLEIWSEDNGELVEILCASSGKEGFQILKEKKVHILLTDIRMPEMTGLELVKLIEQKEEAPVVIVMSAYSEFDYAQKAIQLGVVNYLLKPISKAKLIEAIEKAKKIEESREHSGLIKKVVDEQLLNIEENENQTHALIKEAIQFIDNNLHERLNQKEVADLVHLNASYFSVLFKEQTGLTFSEYITRRRLQVAKKLLYSTDLPIVVIAEKVGYQTAKYFIKIFKEFEGFTPSQYRKQLAKEEERKVK
ncbi:MULTISPECIES: response regulator transcription factor [Bacillaceae]|uniref:Response regulator n=1 Tax=Evansella alkalicola TaxID=745819 RepID=A0ABS6JPV0_9BACI|nr:MULTISPECIES: response regulator [Bacillaceae]MBU9720591.1 response regulator [Bacillus alkalicola]